MVSKKIYIIKIQCFFFKKRERYCLSTHTHTKHIVIIFFSTEPLLSKKKEMSDEVKTTPESTEVPPAVVPEPAAAASGDAAPRTIFVKNISESATTKTLVDFFSFCGAIEHIKLHPVVSEEDRTQLAEITFETAEGANTALLLDNSLILDRPIKIVVSSAENSAEIDAAAAADNASAKDDDEKGEKKTNIEDSEFMKNAATAVGGIVAESYALGTGIKNAVIDVDKNIGFSASVKKTATDIDEALGLSTKATAASTFVSQKFTEFDNAVGISAAAHSATTSIQEAASNVAKTPAVSSTLSLFRSWGNSISRTYGLFQRQSEAAIQVKKEQLAASRPAPPPPAAEEEEEEEAEKKKKEEMPQMSEVGMEGVEEKAPELPPKPVDEKTN